MKVSYLYQIRNLVNGKLYIGSSNHPAQRFASHRKHLRKGIHHSCHLQKAWNKYGEDMFVFEILGEVPLEERFQKEAELIIKEDTTNTDYGYNLVVPDDNGGYIHNTASNEKIRQAIIQKNLQKRAKVVFINLVTMEKTTFDTVLALKATGVNTSKKLNKLYKTYWNYESVLNEMPEDFYTDLQQQCENWQSLPIPVYCFDITTRELVHVFSSTGLAAKTLKTTPYYISNIVNANHSKHRVGNYTFSRTDSFPDKPGLKKKKKKEKGQPTLRYKISNGTDTFYGKILKDFTNVVPNTSTNGWQKLLSGNRKTYRGFTMNRL